MVFLIRWWGHLKIVLGQPLEWSKIVSIPLLKSEPDIYLEINHHTVSPLYKSFLSFCHLSNETSPYTTSKLIFVNYILFSLTRLYKNIHYQFVLLYVQLIVFIWWPQRKIGAHMDIYHLLLNAKLTQGLNQTFFAMLQPLRKL